MQDIEFTVRTRQTVDAADAQRANAPPLLHSRSRSIWRTIGLITRAGGDRSGLIPLSARSAAASDARSQGDARRDRTGACPRRPARHRGKVVFDSRHREKWMARWSAGQSVILVRVSRPAPKTSTACTPPRAYLTARGGMTSHAAVVARGMGRPCVSGAGSLRDRLREAKTLRVSGHSRSARVTCDHHRRRRSGEVMLGEVATVQPELSGDFAALMVWADAARRLKVRANAETPLDCRKSRVDFGAEGIGLCRTEHMFFEAANASPHARDDPGGGPERGRKLALAKLLPEQRSRFCRRYLRP